MGCSPWIAPGRLEAGGVGYFEFLKFSKFFKIPLHIVIPGNWLTVAVALAVAAVVLAVIAVVVAMATGSVPMETPHGISYGILHVILWNIL